MPVGDTDDRDRVRDLGVVVMRVPDNESPAIEPFEGARPTDSLAREHGVGSLGLPSTDEAVPLLEFWFLAHRTPPVWLTPVALTRSQLAIVGSALAVNLRDGKERGR